MSARHLLLALVPVVVACRKEPPPDALPKVEGALTEFAGTLRKKFGDAMKEGGPLSAIDVCSREAPALYAKVRAEKGVTIGRSSLRLRNPGDAPPAWVAEWLRAQGERKAEGVAGVRTVAEVDGRKVARVLKPIAIEAPCLKCHGKEVAPEVKQALAAKYPSDAATGYELGDLRGALWGELPLTQ